MKKEKPTEIVEPELLNLEAIQEATETSKELMPQMNVGVPATADETAPIISNEKLVQVYDEALNNIREDRLEIDSLYTEFKEMVINGGDATTSSKEALVNLIKIKLDTADKISKIADLMTRARGINTFPRYLAAHQNNTINIEAKKTLTPDEKRALIENENKKLAKDVI